MEINIKTPTNIPFEFFHAQQFCSKSFLPLFTVFLQDEWSRVGFFPSHFEWCCHSVMQSLYINFGLCAGLFPSANSSYRRFLGILSSSILTTWPFHHNWRWITRESILVDWLRSMISMSLTYICHQTPSIQRRHCWWNRTSLFTCLY